MKDQLLTIKLYTPPLRTGIVRRPRLLQKLDAGLQQGSQLSLISAPAGYGKTTLVLEWLAAQERDHSWLSLDRGDNHPALFLAYLIAALQQVDATIGQEQLAGLHISGGASPDGVWLQHQLIPLINQLSTVQKPFVLVLDDYHVIHELAIHEALTFLLEHQPPQMHLVITTRQDPLLPLSRLRSRGRLTEIRLSDLRFTSQEGAAFLNETMALALSPDELAALEARTEGWIAGLQLAALSLAQPQAGADSSSRTFDLAASFDDDRHVVDYLMDEVLSRQPAQLQKFLLQTSILQRLCAPLCDALVDPEDGGAGDDPLATRGASPSQRVLEELERRNVFIISLDNQRHWYRYHHLFGSILQNRLQSSDPRMVAGLHRRASEWFEQQGLMTEAVDHALLAEELAYALSLIERSARTNIWASGDLPTLLNWSKRLPEAALLARPGLCLYYARGLFFTGQVDTAERYLDAAVRALQAREASGAQGGSDQPLEELWGIAYTNQATFAAMRGEAEDALQIAGRAQPLLAADDDSTHARLAHAVGMAYYHQGQPAAAAQRFDEGILLAEKAANQILRLDLIACLALARLMAGQLGAAERLCCAALAGNASRPPAACAVYLAMAEAYYEQYRLQEAQQAVEKSIALARKASWLHVLSPAYALQACIRRAAGDHDGALEALREAEQVAGGYRLPHVQRLVDACRAALFPVEEAARRAAPAGEKLETPAIVAEREGLAWARAHLASGAASESLALLDDLLSAAEAAGRGRAAVEALVLRGLALQASGDAEGAAACVRRAVTAAAPEEFARPFLAWYGLPGAPAELAALLRQVAREGLEATERRFVYHLLAALGATAEEPPDREYPEAADLVEPLSERELEVLALIAEGLSNPEVAERLYLSPNTVRVHTSNIYAKLGVHGRVAAVTRARSLHILPGD